MAPGTTGGPAGRMTARTTPWTALLDVLFDDPSVGRCLVAPDGTILRANSEWLRSTGLRTEDAIGADMIALLPEGRDAALAQHARARAGHTVQVPRYARRIDGRETWWDGSVAPIPMEGGTGLLVTARDAAARTALDDLQESEDRFRAVFESAFDAVFLSDPSGEGRVLMANPAACRMFGYTEEELRGVTRGRILDASDPNLSAFLAAPRSSAT